MFRATTPTHTFNLPFEASTIDKMTITYSQFGKIILKKNLEDVQLIDSKIILTLTQEETKLFKADTARVQLRVKIGDKVMASNIISLNVEDVLDKEVL